MRRFHKKRHTPPEEFMQRALRARSAARGLEHFFDHRLTGHLNNTATDKEKAKQERHAASHKRHAWHTRLKLRLITYFYKMRGNNPVTYAFSWKETFWSFGGAFLGMLILALVNIEAWGRHEQGLLLGSFGASAMLVFGAPHAPFAQPRNVIGGHLVSALAGVLVQQFLGWEPWLAAALAVALAVSLMHITATLHPPGGATALLAVIGGTEIHNLGYMFIAYPVGLSVITLVATGIAYNNLSRSRRYPLYWW